MRDTALPAAILVVSVGSMLGFTTRKADFLAGAATVIAVTLATSAIRLPDTHEVVFLGTWLLIAITALSGLAAKSLPGWLAIPVAACASAFIGLLNGEGSESRIVAMMGLLVLAGTSARLFVASGHRLFVRVAAGWLLAVAVLNVALTMLPVTPGYFPDHLE